MRKLLAVMLVLFLLTGLTACGGASKAADTVVRQEAAMEAPAAMENSSLTSDAQSDSSALPENRKWVITMHMNTETEDLTAMLKAVDEKILSLGGYVEDQNIHNGSKYANRRYRNASLTVRIPAEKVDDFTGTMEEISNVVNTEKNLEDITLAYVSTESRLKALQTEEERLLELMAQAEDMSDLLTIEARLTEVRYQLENAASKLRIYDNQVDYATIYLSIEEVLQYTPVAEKTVWERISDGFGNSLENVLIPVYPDTQELVVAMSSDDGKYGGFDQVAHQVYPAKEFNGQYYVELYLPARTAVVLKEGKIVKKPAARKTASVKKTEKKASVKKTTKIK